MLSATTRILSSAAETIVAAHKSRHLDSTAARAQSANIASMFAHVAVPHILSCLLECVFGGDAAAHLWHLHLEGEEEVSSTSQTVSLLTRQVCAPIIMVWGQLTTGPLQADDTVKQSVTSDTDEVRPTSDAHLPPLTTALEKHQPSGFQHGEAKEYNDLSTIKEAPHSIELNLPQEKEYESNVVTAHSAGFAPALEMRKDESEVLEKPNPFVLVEEIDLEVASSLPENDGFPPIVSEDLKTVRLNSSAVESVKRPLSSAEKITIRGADYAYLASMEESKPGTISSALPETKVDESSNHLGSWPYKEIREEAASCHLTEPNQEEVVHEDVEALPINPVSLSTQESRIEDYTAPEVTVPPVIRGTVEDAQGDKRSDEVNEESVAVVPLKVAAAATAKDHPQFSNIAIAESGQHDVETHARHTKIEAVDKLSLDARRSAEIITMDGNTTAESKFNSQSTFLETEGDQSNHDTASQPYRSHSLLKEHQSSTQDKGKSVQSSSTPHDLTAEAPEFGVVGSKMTLSYDIPSGVGFLSVQKTSPLIEESGSFATSIRDEGPPDGLGSPFLKDAFLEQSKLDSPESLTRNEYVCGESQESASTLSDQRGLDIQELLPSTRGNDASPSRKFINSPSAKASENDVNNSCTIFFSHDNGNVPPPVMTTPVLGVSDKIDEFAVWDDEKSGGDDRNSVGHLTTTGRVCVSTVSDEQGIDIQASHESLFPPFDQTNFSNHSSTTPLLGNEGNAVKDNSIFSPDLRGDNAGELSASAAGSVPAVMAICPTSIPGPSNTDSGRANWVAGGYAMGEMDDSGHAESVNINNRDIGYCEEELVISKEDKLFMDIDASIVNKLKEGKTSGAVATDIQSSLVEQAARSGSTEGELVEVDNRNAWVRDFEVGVGELEKQVAFHPPNLDTSPEPALNKKNTEGELSADSGFGVDVRLLANEDIDVAGIGNIVESTIVDRKIEAVSTVGNEFGNCEDAWEVDTDPSDFANLPNLGMDAQSIYQCQLNTKISYWNETDGSENIHERSEVSEEDALKSQTLITSGKPVTKLQQPKVDELASGVSAEDRLTFAKDSNALGKGSLKANVEWGDYAGIGVIQGEKRGVLPEDSGKPITQSPLATELIQQNNEVAFESKVQASKTDSFIVTGAENRVPLPILDRASGDVGDVDGGSADWECECEVAKDPSNSATIPTVHGLTEIDSHGADTKNADLSRTWGNQDEQSNCDVALPDIEQTYEKCRPSSRLMSESKSLEPSSPRDSEAFSTSDVIASHRTESADFDKPCRSQNRPEKLALLDVDRNDGDNLWGEDADIDIKDEGKSDLHADDKLVELDSNLVQRNTEGELGPIRQSKIDTNVSVNEAQGLDVHENLLVSKKFGAESFEEEAIKAKLPTPLNEWKTEVEKVEADEHHSQEEPSSEKCPEAGQSPLSEKPPNNNDWGEDENTWGEDADISVNVTKKHYELGRSKSDCALTEKAGYEAEVMSITHIPSAPPFCNANTSQSGTTHFLRTVVDWREKRLLTADAVTSISCIVLESSSVHSEPPEIQFVEVDRLKGVDANLKGSCEGLFEAKPSDAANNGGWDVDF